MKHHRFWAWGAVVCMVMAIITGYRTAECEVSNMNIYKGVGLVRQRRAVRLCWLQAAVQQGREESLYTRHCRGSAGKGVRDGDGHLCPGKCR